jgi:DNA repair ATPase RecN
MLTRLKVSGFKNFVDIDVRFGAFTCIAGANRVGKSNRFDAIKFLSAYAYRPLLDAGLSICDEGGKTADLCSLFHRVGNDIAKIVQSNSSWVNKPEDKAVEFPRYMHSLVARHIFDSGHCQERQ